MRTAAMRCPPRPHLQPPAWMRQRVEAPLVQAGMVAPGFVDSIALNMYHDGSEGIQVRSLFLNVAVRYWRRSPPCL